MTQSPNGSKSIGRTILAVVAGLVFIFVTHNGMDAVMHLSGIFPPMGQPMANGLWGLALGYRILFSIIGCYLTAYMAPARPMQHAMILGWIGVLLSLLGVLAFWNKGPEFGPKWYPIALVFISLPCAWLGGKLRERQLKLS
jgi:hypothetical protein